MTYTLTLTAQEMQVLDAALGGLPFRQVAPLIQSINRQIAEQEQAAKHPLGGLNGGGLPAEEAPT